jgi:hypothetical protein
MRQFCNVVCHNLFLQRGLEGASDRMTGTNYRLGAMLCYIGPSRGRCGRVEHRQAAFREIARHSGEQSSIGFQAVSGIGLDTGLDSNGPFRREPSE